jgi:ankyrin repeat protein
VDEVRSDEPSMVRAVLHYKPDVNAQTEPGNTPVMLAAMQGIEHAAKVLIEAHADLKLKNAAGHDALQLAVRNGNTTVGEMIAKKLGVRFLQFCLWRF